MSFRRALRLLLAAQFAFIGCAKENELSSPPVKKNSTSSFDSCLSNFGDKMTDFMNGNMPDKKIEELWNCMANLVRHFQKQTDGSVGGAYTPQALRKFLTMKLGPGTVISDKLLAEIMEIKRVLLSGDSKLLRDEELTRMQDLLMVIKQASVDMNPYIPLLLGKKDDATDAELGKAARALDQLTDRLGSWLKENNQSYSYAHLKGLIDEIRALQESDGDHATMDKIMSLLPNIKQILVAGSLTGFGGSEWAPLMKSLGQGYSAYLYAKYGFNGGLDKGLTGFAAPEVMVSVSEVLKRGLELRPEKEIVMTEWRTLFEKIETTGWLPEAMSAKALTKTWHWFIRRMLAYGRIEPDVELALKLEHLRTLDQQASNWLALLDYAHGSKPSKKDAILVKFDQLIKASKPVEWDAFGRMMFTYKIQDKWMPEGIQHLVWPFALLNWVKDAFYGPEIEGITAAQGKEIAGEILPVLQSYGWMKDTQASIGARLVEECTTFTLVSDGNDNLDMREASHYLAFVASSFAAAQHWLDAADKICKSPKPDCLAKSAVADPDVFAATPRLAAFVAKQKDPVAWVAKYLSKTDEVINGDKPTEGFSTGGALEIWNVFQYIETFVRRFDANGNETINLADATKSYDVYGHVLHRVLPKGPDGKPTVPPAWEWPIYTFMMKHGELPFCELGCDYMWYSWRMHEKDWEFEADRIGLMSILQNLAKVQRGGI